VYTYYEVELELIPRSIALPEIEIAANVCVRSRRRGDNVDLHFLHILIFFLVFRRLFSFSLLGGKDVLQRTAFEYPL
jgi:hypothetical protein